jgi:glycosyltransferase involved in cell wall biosynthesis
MKKVSIIQTTFNGQSTLERTLNSILSQRGINHDFEMELIVVDDCSTDHTPGILKRFNVNVLSTGKNSGGPNKGRNIGLKMATGDFICIADQDDFWEADRIITLMPYLNKAPVVTSGYTLIDTFKNMNISRVNQNGDQFVHFAKNQTFLQLLSKSQSGQNAYLGSIIFNHELKYLLFEEHFGMVDFDWILRLFHQRESIEVCKSLYQRNVSGANLSLNEAYRIRDFYYSLMTLENYETSYPKEVSIAYKKIHGSRARYYYLLGNMKKARRYFLKSQWSLKTLAYFLTSFAGSDFVKKKFNVFG